MTRFGIEEEFLLVDRSTLVPLAMADGTRERLAPEGGGRILPEFLTSQFECVTDPLSSMTDAAAQLRNLRTALAAHATPLDAVIAASGTPFNTTGHATISASPHYDRVSAQLGAIARGHEVNGLHVHVEVADAEERVRALNRVRGWLPVLLALTGNSPFAEGAATGFASWRSILIRRLPATWTPPWFHDLTDYEGRVDRLIALSAIPERSSLSWAARLSDRFPTVESRVCDAQLSIDDTLFAAALTRAIVVAHDGPASAAPVDQIDAGLWVAARHGMAATITDPTTGETTDAWAATHRLLDVVRHALEQLGDAEFVTAHIGRLRREGTGAERQLRAHAHDGLRGLRRLHLAGSDTEEFAGDFPAEPATESAAESAEDSAEDSAAGSTEEE
ncbi:YbdK family carboxylate-amine ligase [Microbacterium sp. NPDC087868]|uniref:carboxylate-amine ligase n=1 Tax=Microbacterium sp. NPDC087868 TaxID=3364195 RepID=UPI00384D4F1E